MDLNDENNGTAPRGKTVAAKRNYPDFTELSDILKIHGIAPD